MEHKNNPAVAKRISNILRVIFYMLRKSITSKAKLLLTTVDLSTMLKRGRISGNNNNSTNNRTVIIPSEYEFSCSNTPRVSFPSFHVSKLFACAHAPVADEDDVATAHAVKATLEMMIQGGGGGGPGVAAESPWLPGFGRSPAVMRQLRVTDSPFPLAAGVEEEDRHVDEAAEEFIMKFYRNLRKQ